MVGAERHGVLPLLLRGLERQPGFAVPEAVRGQLRERYRQNARHNLLLTGELLRVLGILDSAGIAAVPWKGPLLAETVYETSHCGCSGDLDVLVPRRDTHTARELLGQAGYRSLLKLDRASSSSTPGSGRRSCSFTSGADHSRRMLFLGLLLAHQLLGEPLPCAPLRLAAAHVSGAGDDPARVRRRDRARGALPRRRRAAAIGAGAGDLRARASASRASASGTAKRRPSSATSTCSSGRARRPRSSALPALARRRWRTSCLGFSSRTRAASWSTACR